MSDTLLQPSRFTHHHRVLRAVLHWKTAEIDTLHWQGKTWIPLSDCPQLLDSPRPLIRA